jgi:ribose transport system substrate-binding protein
MDRGAYQELLRRDCEEAARQQGFPFRAFSAEGDAGRQASQIEAFIREASNDRPEAIIVAPVREISLLASARAAARLGVGVVLLGRHCGYLDDLRKEFPECPIFSVLTDQHEIGRIQAKQLKALLPQGGEAVYILGLLGTSSATERLAGMQEALPPKVNLLTLNSDWTVEGGRRAIKGWAGIFARRGMPSLVVAAQNDSMAMGARAAWEEMARDARPLSLHEVRFCGVDGVPELPEYGQRLVREGQLSCTVVRPPGAGRAVTEIVGMRGGGARPPTCIVLKPKAFPDPGALRPFRLRHFGP